MSNKRGFIRYNKMSKGNTYTVQNDSIKKVSFRFITVKKWQPEVITRSTDVRQYV